jgi:hypothetical protein
MVLFNRRRYQPLETNVQKTGISGVALMRRDLESLFLVSSEESAERNNEIDKPQNQSGEVFDLLERKGESIGSSDIPRDEGFEGADSLANACSTFPLPFNY